MTIKVPTEVYYGLIEIREGNAHEPPVDLSNREEASFIAWLAGYEHTVEWIIAHPEEYERAVREGFDK